MSNFRERARAIKAEGEAQRGNFTPTGAPLRVYQNYYKDRYDAPARENFCHFWRIVLIWSPLNAVWKRVEPVVNSLAFAVVMIALLLGALIWAALTFSTFGEIVLLILFVSLMMGLLFGFVHVVDKFWRKSWDKYVPWIAGTVIGGLVLVGLTFVFLALLDGVGLLTTLALFIGVPLGAAAFVFALVAVSDWVKARARIEERKYWDYLDEYYEEHGEYPPTRKRKPSKVKAILSNIGDFFVLIGQVVRVKKWKICPFVEIPDSDPVDSPQGAVLR